jgi:hypothetical protein
MNGGHMGDRPDLRVVQLRSDQKAHLGSLSERIKEVIYDYAGEFEVTIAEIVGVLEAIKYDLLEEREE